MGTADLAALHAGPGAPGRGDAGDRGRHRRRRRAGPPPSALGGVERGRVDAVAAADPAARAGTAGAGQPARLGAVVDAAGAAGGRPDPPRPRRAAAGEPGLRRVLLLPLGGEHPRGQGLHVQPALGGRALRRRLVAACSAPRWPPRSPRRPCWRPGTSWAGWPRCRPARTSWSRPASTRSARCCSACRPRPAWPGWPAPTPGSACGWTSWPSTRPGWRRPRRDEVRRRGGRPTWRRPRRSPWCSATPTMVAGPRSATLDAVDGVQPRAE